MVFKKVSLLFFILIFIFLIIFSKKYLSLRKKQYYVSINDIKILVQLASTSEQKNKGLSNRSSLEGNRGMLFVFQTKSYPGFWMKDMFFPIDIIWISDNKIISIDKNIKNPDSETPESKLKLYFPPNPIDYVLEVNAGFSDRNNIEVGDNVILNL